MTIKLFLTWRLGLLVLTYFGSQIFPLSPNGGVGAIGPGKDFSFIWSMAQWDGGHYLNIINNGYQLENLVFFPLFPILTKALSPIFLGNALIAGLVLSNIFFFLFLLIFYSFLKDKYNQKVAFSITITYLLFPTSYFAVSFYSESTFLLLVSLTLFFLKTKKLLLASIAIALAGATRFVGIFLILLLLENVTKESARGLKNSYYKLFYLAVALAGIMLYLIYQQAKFNSPLLFLSLQSYWQRSPANPLTTIYNYLTNNFVANTPIGFFDFFTTIAFLTILILGYKKIPRSWFAYSLFVLLVPISTGTLASMPRYVLAAFPAFILIGQFLSQRKRLGIFVWGLFLFLQVALAIMFINGHWTA